MEARSVRRPPARRPCCSSGRQHGSARGGADRRVGSPAPARSVRYRVRRGRGQPGARTHHVDNAGATRAGSENHAAARLHGGHWAIAAAAVATAAVYAGTTLEHGFALLVLLAVTGFLTERFDVEVTPQLWISSSAVVTIVAAVLLGPVGAGAVGFAELLSDVDEPPLSRWLVHAPLRTLCGVAAGVAASVDASLAVKVAFAAITCLTVDAAGNAVIMWLRHHDNIGYLRTLAVALYLPLRPVPAGDRGRRAGLRPLRAGRPGADPLAGGAGAVRATAGDRERAARLRHADRGHLVVRDRHGPRARGLRLLHAPATPPRWACTRATSRSSSATRPSAASVVQLAALLHDVGKIGVPGEILRKPDRLTDEEWSEIRRHPRTGEQIIGEVPVFRLVAEAIRHHHERPDGPGYPDGLAAARSRRRR